MATVSVTALLFPAAIYPTRELLQSLLSNDAVNLVVGLPVLFASLWLTRRGLLVGLLLWPGALLYVLYNYLILLFCMPLNVAYLLHLALVMLSLYTIISLVAGIEGRTVRQRLIGTVPAKASGAVLAAFGILFFVRVAATMGNAVLRRTAVGTVDRAVDVADFLVTPAWIIGGVLLWRRATLGYSVGLALLLQGSMLFVGLIAYLALQPFITGARFVLIDVLVIFGMALVFFIPFGRFARGVQ